MIRYFPNSDHLFDPFISFLTQPYVPWVLTVLIAGWAFCTWLFFRVIRLGPAFKAVRTAQTIFGEARDAAEFAEKFESMSERVSRIRIFGTVWSRFAQELLLPELSGERIKTPVKASAVFNRNALLHEAGINMRFYQAMPNYLLGVGLLCTFLGLFCRAARGGRPGFACRQSRGNGCYSSYASANCIVQQRPQDEVEGAPYCAKQRLYESFALLLLIGSLIALIGQALTPDALDRQLQYHAKISD